MYDETKKNSINLYMINMWFISNIDTRFCVASSRQRRRLHGYFFQYTHSGLRNLLVRLRLFIVEDMFYVFLLPFIKLQ